MTTPSKTVLDVIGVLTPLIIGVLITGVGAIFTHVYNARQLQLNQIAALDKLRPLLSAEKPQDREFAYASFVALGYEKLAIRLIEIQRDETGRSVLTQLKNSGPAETRDKAVAALLILDEAQNLVNIFEFGTPAGDEEMLKEDPELAAAFAQGRKWAEETARDLGISSKLGVAILYDTATHMGATRAGKFKQATSEVISLPLDSRDKEKSWLSEFVRRRDEAMQSGPMAKLYPAIKKRTDKLQRLLEAGDWDLSTVPKPSPKPIP